MITQERLRELIDYNPGTGMAFWKVGRLAGSRVGCAAISKRSKPYRWCRLAEGWKEKKTFSHVVFFYMTGRWPTAEIDHANGDTLDDRWTNLREATREQNEANRGARKNSQSGIKGVFPIGNRYRCEITRLGTRKYLGVFDTEQEASAAYLSEAAKYDGQFLRIA